MKSYSATITADMYCSHLILKTLGKLFERWSRYLLNVWILYFWIRITEFFYRKSLLILRSKSCWVILTRPLKLNTFLTHPPDFLPSRHVWNFPRSAPYPCIHEQVTSLLFGEYAWFKRVIVIHIFLFIYLWHHRKPYPSFMLIVISPHAGPFKTSRFVWLFAIINRYSATIEAAIHCSHPILQTIELLFERWDRCLFNVLIICLN